MVKSSEVSRGRATDGECIGGVPDLSHAGEHPPMEYMDDFRGIFVALIFAGLLRPRPPVSPPQYGCCDNMLSAVLKKPSFCRKR